MKIRPLPTSKSFEEANALLDLIRGASKNADFNAKCSAFSCLFFWLDQMQQNLDRWRYDPSFDATRAIWNKQVDVYLELLRCFIVHIPVRLPTSPNDLTTAAARKAKDEDEESAGVMAGMVLELNVALSSPADSIRPSSQLEVILQEVNSSSRVNFQVLLLRAIETNDVRLLKWLLEREHKICYITDGAIDSVLWSEAKRAYSQLIPKSVSGPEM